MAFERYNGGSLVNQLGYFFGESAFATVAVSGHTPFDGTGVVASLAEFKRVHNLDVGAGAVGEGQNIDVLSVVQRTINGVEYKNDVEYVAGYAKQENLKRIVDTIQQSAVIAATSTAKPIVAATDVARFFNDQVPGTATGVSLPVGAYAISFLIERAAVFNKDATNLYGQPGSAVVGLVLMEALNGISLLSPTLVENKLVPGATTPDPKITSNYGVAIVGTGALPFDAIL